MHSSIKTYIDSLKASYSEALKDSWLYFVGDFGISKKLSATLDVASTCIGTPTNLAPEMCQDIPYSSKADVWVCYSIRAFELPVIP